MSSESHKCHLCGKPAKVHLTQIVQGKIHKIDLCEDCAQAKGLNDPDGPALTPLQGMDPLASRENRPLVPPACPSCDFTPKDFKRLGRFGCPQCYETFAPLLEPVLANMHPGIDHHGKVPKASLVRAGLQKRLGALETSLRDAIQSERYEEAARFRDEISSLRESLESSPEEATDNSSAS